MDWRYIPQGRIEFLIALSRLVFACFILLAVWIDPYQPARYTVEAYGVMTLYAVYSLALCLVALRAPYVLKRLALITHGFDLAFSGVFILASAGPTSPFFSYIIFVMMCATLRWHWRGTLYTFIIVSVAYFCLALYADQMLHDPRVDLETFVFRDAYLGVITFLIAYSSAQLLKIWNEFSALAQWPMSDVRDIYVLTRELLKNASAVSGAPRSLVLWDESDEPWLYTASYSEGTGLQMSREAPDAFGEIVPATLMNRNFICFNAEQPRTAILCESKSGFDYLSQISPVSHQLQARYKIRSMLSMKLQGERFQGRLFLLDKSNLTSDDLVKGRIIAARVSQALNEHYLVTELRRAAATEERISLARDLHDGLLQSLAGIGIKIRTASLLIDRDSILAKQELAGVGNLLTYEQRDLRCLVHELKPFSNGARNSYPSFLTSLEDLAGLIRQNWGLQVELNMGSVVFPLAGVLEREVYFIIREALVNTAKHAAASNLRVDLEAANGKICVVVTDDGCGFPFRGRYDLPTLKAIQQGPRTIMERVGALGGDLLVDSSDSGTSLRIELAV